MNQFPKIPLNSKGLSQLMFSLKCAKSTPAMHLLITTTGTPQTPPVKPASLRTYQMNQVDPPALCLKEEDGTSSGRRFKLTMDCDTELVVVTFKGLRAKLSHLWWKQFYWNLFMKKTQRQEKATTHLTQAAERPVTGVESCSTAAPRLAGRPQKCQYCLSPILPVFFKIHCMLCDWCVKLYLVSKEERKTTRVQVLILPCNLGLGLEGPYR